MIKNKDFALALIQDKRQVLEHVSAALKNDKDIVLAALENTPNAMEFISSALEEDGDIVATYVRKFIKQIIANYETNK